jgi:membrane protein YdbS with pleckstrin-like domain
MIPFTNETIDLELLPKYEDASLSRPHSKYWTLIVINTSIFLILIGVGLTTAFILNENARMNWPIWSALYVIFAVILFVIYRASFKRRGFALREKDVLYKSGIIAATTTIVPLNRIQHVALNEGVLSRMFKLGTLQVYTAGGNSGQINIVGIPIEQAKVMKEALVQRLVVKTEN